MDWLTGTKAIFKYTILFKLEHTLGRNLLISNLENHIRSKHESFQNLINLISTLISFDK